MEVDRISGMGGIRPQTSPSWPASQLRRRRFVEEFESSANDSESEADEEQQNPPDQETAQPDSSAPGDDEPGRGTEVDLLA
jgi:hypothetical protein